MDHALSDDSIESYIPGVQFNVVTALEIMCCTDQQRAMPATVQATIRQASIIKPAAHTDARTTLIKRNQRHEDQIQVTRIHRLARTC